MIAPFVGTDAAYMLRRIDQIHAQARLAEDRARRIANRIPKHGPDGRFVGKGEGTLTTRRQADRALMNSAPSGLRPSGFDPSREVSASPFNQGEAL